MPRYRKILSPHELSCSPEFTRLAKTQTKKALACWAVDYAERVMLPIWQAVYPADDRPQAALRAACEWLSGSMKLPAARAAILACHAAARGADGEPAAQAGARAIGQCASTIHSARHSLGLPLYGGLAVAYHELGVTAPWTQVILHAERECGRMLADLRPLAIHNEPGSCSQQ